MSYKTPRAFKGRRACAAPESSVRCLFNATRGSPGEPIRRQGLFNVRGVDTSPRKEGLPPLPGPNNSPPSASRRIRNVAGDIVNKTSPISSRPGFYFISCDPKRAPGLTHRWGICGDQRARQGLETKGCTQRPPLFLEQMAPWRHWLRCPRGHCLHLKTSMPKLSCQRISGSNFSVPARGNARLLAALIQNRDSIFDSCFSLSTSGNPNLSGFSSRRLHISTVLLPLQLVTRCHHLTTLLLCKHVYLQTSTKEGQRSVIRNLGHS